MTTMFLRLLLASLLTLGLLAACAGVDLTPAATPLPAVPTATALFPTLTPTVHVSPIVLRVWVPSRFDPQKDTLLQARLDSFLESHPGLKIDVRVKEETGAASLLESLLVTSSAAPSALPDLVALPREDLESAAAAGVIQPVDGLKIALDKPGWALSARALGHVQNTAYGLPFALDALVLASSVPEPVTNWVDVVLEGPLAFNVHDASFPLALYLAAGGTLIDDQGKPALDETILARVLALFAQETVVPLESDEAVWQSFGQAGGFAVGWATDLTRRDQPGARIEALPGFEDSSATLVTGWVWAVASLDADRQKLAVELAEWLTAEEFVGAWDESSGYLSPRSDARWEAVLASGRVMPSSDLLIVIGPALEEAVASVLAGVSPELAARTAVEALK
jgi:ABC-type glycerol-3-phosphate transport system substrate-binding protein